MYVSNISGWSVTTRHNMLSSHSLFTRPAVVRASTLFRLLVLLDIVGAFAVANSKKKGKNTRLSACLSLSLSLSLPLNSVSVNSTKKTRRRRHEEAQKKTRQPPKISSSSSSLRQSPSERVFDLRRVRHKKCAVFVTRGRRVRRRRRPRLYSNKAQSLGRTTPKKLKIWRGHKNTLIRRE